jgi:ATP-dependent exoDNAse (exonuclease V) beta subunit
MSVTGLRRIFIGDDGQFRPQTEIAETVILVKDITQSNGIKLEMMEWLKENNYSVSFLPDIKAVHDLAREISGVGAGGEIREEDFLVLMERCNTEGLFEKFKKPHFRNYKKNLLKLLNYLELKGGDSEDKAITEDLEKNGLVPEVLDGVKKFINGEGYYFKGQIFSEAVRKNVPAGNTYYINFSEGEYSVAEKEFLTSLGAQKIVFKTEGRFSSLAGVFKADPVAFIHPESVEFYVSSSILDEAQRIKHLILQTVTGNEAYRLNDISVVCSNEDTFRILNNYLYAENIPVYSSYRSSGNDINTDVLRLFKSGAEGDAQSILNFFNLYIAQKPLLFDDLTELDLKTLIAKIFEMKGSDYKLKASADVKKFIKDFLNASLVEDRIMSAEKALAVIKSKLKRLKKAFMMLGKELETDIYSYEETVKRIFGDTERKFTDYIEYLYLIATKTNAEKLNKEINGVRIMMLNEPAPAGKFLIFSGMTEDRFLKASNPLKIVSKENYFRLYKSVYGIDPEEALFGNLRMITSGGIERTAFFVPRWGEEFIPSTKLDMITALLPKKSLEIEILSVRKVEDPPAAEFSVTISDKLEEKDFGELTVTRNETKPGKDEFGIRLKEGIICDKLVSASKIESFMACPAAHVHDLNLEYDSIEPQFPFTKGNFYHGTVEKFLTHFKGNDLLDDIEFAKVVSGLSGGKSKDEIAKTRFGEFPEFLLFGVDYDKFNDPYKILSEKIKSSDILSFIDSEILKQEKNDPYSFYARIKQRSEIIGFLAWLMIELGPTPASVTRSFETEVKFADFEICKDPEISIKRGYIDFLFIDHTGTVRIIDIKSNKKFEKFEEEIEKYQKVQLLLYREAVSRWIRGESGVNIMPEKEEDKPQDEKCSILPSGYFDSLSKDAKVEAFYYSPNNPLILPVSGQSFQDFLSRLKVKLGNKEKYKPDACSKCEYCSLSQSCPEFEDKKFEEIKGFKNNPDAEKQSLKLINIKNDKEDREVKKKKFIIFDGDKENALTYDGNIIISAGAGAGKTEVLSSKYISLLLNTEAGLENIVCITFTKKAAGEMQKRIYSKLNDILESGYFFSVYKAADPNAYRITEKQKEKLSKVKKEFYDKNLISTFHSFCNKFIAEYGYSSENLKSYDIAADLSEDFTVGEEARKFLKSHFDSHYSGILDGVLKGGEYEEFQSWLGSRHLIYEGDQEGGFIPDILKLYDEMKLSGRGFEEKDWIEPLKDYMKMVEERIQAEFGDYFSIREDILRLIENETDEKLTRLGEKIRNYKEFSYKQASKKYPDIFAFAEALSESDGYKIFNKRNVDLSLNGKEWIIKKAVFSIVKALNGHLNDFKRGKGFIEQSDLHSRFLEMLYDNELKNEFQTAFRYILVDEFQDTNWLQDKIIGTLNGKDNRFFLVGDKKQSIYRFQQCDVQIFEKYEKSDRFKTLYFSENYRSVPHLVDFNNKVFEKNAPNGYNIISDEKELLKPVKKDNRYSGSVNFVNICTNKAKQNNEGIKAGELSRISKMCEAAFVADTILEGAKNGKKFGSWAVLIRKYTHIGYITEALRKKSIPYTLILKKDLFEIDEVKEFVLILKVILGAAAPEEIEFIPDHEKLISGIKKDDPLISLVFRIRNSKIYTNYLASIGDYRTKSSTVDILKETLISLLDKSDNDRERFLTLLEKNIKANSSGVEVKDPDAVTIMTVHSAKGLEFDDLIVANVDEGRGNFTSHLNYLNLCEKGSCYNDFSMAGYSTPGGGEKKNFFINEYIKHKNKSFDEKENANLLYVALTRAKNSLTVVIQTKEETGNGDTEKKEGWAKYLRQFGTGKEENINGFCFIQKDVCEFDLRGYFAEEGQSEGTYQAEIEYDLSGHIKTDGLTSATRIAHGQDEVTHEKSNVEAIDTGNFVHLFMSKKIKEIFASGFDLEKELKEFKKKESEPSSVSLPEVKKMISNIISDAQFRKYAECGHVLCEKNIVDTQKKLQGYIDLVLLCGDEVVVLDYKTYLRKYPGDELIGTYKKQVDIYAEALRTIFPDKKIKKYLFFIGRDSAELREIE